MAQLRRKVGNPVNKRVMAALLVAIGSILTVIFVLEEEGHA